MILHEERQAVADAGRQMIADGLVLGTAGNVSIRVGDLVAISPSTVAYSAVTAEDVCVVDMDGVVVTAADGRRPSSEVPMHLSIYRASEAGSVVHHHGIKSAALSTLFDVVPTIHSPPASCAPSTTGSQRSCRTTGPWPTAPPSIWPTSGPSWSSGYAPCTSRRPRSAGPGN